MRELLKRVLNARTIGYPLPPSLVKDIEAELAKPDEPVAWECTRGGFVELTIVHPSQVWGNGNKNIKPLYTHPPVQQKPLSWDASGKEYDRSIHSNPDATAWADLFLETFPNCGADRGTMVGWFANAIMAMYDWKDRQQKPLSDDEIMNFYNESAANPKNAWKIKSVIIETARRLEQAHGIK